MPNDIPVLLYAPFFLTRKGIAALLSSLPGYQLVHEFDNQDHFIKHLPMHSSGLLVLHISEFDLALLEKISQSALKYQHEILLISHIPPENHIQDLLKIGIKGIISQTCSESEVINAIHSVAQGKRFLCHCTLDLMVNEDQTKQNLPSASGLSERELEVLQLIVQGYSSSRISNKLHISTHTVNSHRKNIFKKLKVKSPIQLVTYAVVNGLVKIKK